MAFSRFVSLNRHFCWHRHGAWRHFLATIGHLAHRSRMEDSFVVTTRIISHYCGSSVIFYLLFYFLFSTHPSPSFLTAVIKSFLSLISYSQCSLFMWYCLFFNSIFLKEHASSSSWKCQVQCSLSLTATGSLTLTE